MEKLCAMTYEVDTQEHGLTKQNEVIELKKQASCLTTAKHMAM